MNDATARFGDLRKNRVAEYRWIVIAGISLAAILFQVYVPPFVTYLSYLDLPLLVVVYFSLMRRSQPTGVFLGAAVGLLQDAISVHELGMFGIVKTLAGYFAASLGQRFDVATPMVRWLLACFFFVFHQFFYWVLTQALLGDPMAFQPQRTAVLAVLNAMVAVPLYHMLDRLRVSD